VSTFTVTFFKEIRISRAYGTNGKRRVMCTEFNPQLGSHPVAVVKYTFTHKQYTERHKTNNTYNTNILEKCGPCRIFVGKRDDLENIVRVTLTWILNE
jgi:hypothetical protein